MCATRCLDDGDGVEDRRDAVAQLPGGVRANGFKRFPDYCETIRGGELREGREAHDERKAIRERIVESSGANVRVVVECVAVGGRVHRCPPVAQALQGEALHLPLMDDREEPVLHVDSAPGDLVEKDCLRIPDGRRGLDEAERTLVVGQRVANEIVVVEQAGVVVAPLKTEGLAQARQQQAFCRAVWAHQQDGCLGGKRCEDDRFDGLQANDTEPFPADEDVMLGAPGRTTPRITDTEAPPLLAT